MTKHEVLLKRFCVIVAALTAIMFAGTQSAFAAQEIRVGFIPGRGADAALEDQAFAKAGIVFTRIDKVDYKLSRLLEFDVIGVGVVAYDSNADLKANYDLLKQYVTNGGYLVTLDFQQDSSWNPNFLPVPIALFDDDLDGSAGVVLADHNIFKTPNKLTEANFAPAAWGSGDFTADGPHSANPPWQLLLTDKQNQWPIIVGAPAGKGYVVYSSLQTLQSLGRTGAPEVAQVLQNLLFWRGPLGGRVKASGPSPADGSLLAQTWVYFGWLPGDRAVSHNIYLGDNFADVNNGAAATFRGNQTSTTFLAGLPSSPYPDGLVPGTTYYWRIDEVNQADPNSPWKGDIWSFSLPPSTAYDPAPADGAEFVGLNTSFTWTAGFGAKLHMVYMGTNRDDVNNATTGGFPRGPANYKPASLQSEKVYYWRVDEFDGALTHKGSIWAFTTPGAAGNPRPANGDTNAQMVTRLTWTPATNAASHNIYFGTDKEAVKNATTSSPEYKGNKAKGSESYDPGTLAWQSPYYWRVDAVYNTGVVKGLVWSFTTADFLLIDDFESYNDIDPPGAGSNRIFDKWIDGFGTTTNGAVVGNGLPPYAERTVVHSGAQSMPYAYDNNRKTSEATLTLVWPRDWTAEGVKKLSLWFRGDGANSAERLYVALNGSAVAYYDNPAATQLIGWNQWVIDLQTFAGVNLTNVNTITIGLGTKNSPAAGGTGKIYIDDIRLYRPSTP